jgi:hypothetical protein
MKALSSLIELIPLALLLGIQDLQAQTVPATNDSQIAAAIIRQSRAAYYATGRPCACPEDLARNGSRCGGRSAYSRPGGASPKCYISDVTKEDIEAYRLQR